MCIPREENAELCVYVKRTRWIPAPAGPGLFLVQAPCRGGLLPGQPLPNPLVGWHGLFSRASPARATRSWPHQCLTLPKAAASPEPNCVTVGTGGAAAEVSGEADPRQPPPRPVEKHAYLPTARSAQVHHGPCQSTIFHAAKENFELFALSESYRRQSCYQETEGNRGPYLKRSCHVGVSAPLNLPHPAAGSPPLRNSILGVA